MLSEPTGRRIAIDYTAAVRQAGGIGRYTRGLVHALARNPGNDRYELLVAGPGSDSTLRSDSFRLRRLPLNERYLNILWHRLGLPFPKVEWFSGAVDIFHSPNYVLPPVSAARTVLTVHDLSFLRVPECAEPSLRAYLSRVVPHAVQRADLVLADSESTRRDVVELLGIAEAKIDVVPAGVDGRFRPMPNSAEVTAVRAKYHLGDGPLVLSLGTLEPRKNFVGLMEAFERLVRVHGAPHRLVIGGGRGWLYEGIFEAAERLHLGDRLVFAGFIDDADLPALYKAADLFAFPTLYEGFGLPVLEAMACGVPVVTSDNSCMPELVGDAALLVPTDDRAGLTEAMAAVLGDPALRTRLSASGLLRAELFTWEQAAEKLRASYDKLVEARR